MKLMNQRGMEMAIQIFIVLFVLLAVSMLVLQLVSTQFTQNETQLKDVQKKAAFDQKLKTNMVTCDSLCTGTEAQLVSYCMTTFDFREGTIPLQDDKKYLPGIGVCDDRVYCNQITTCGSGTSELTMEKCKAILCAYWKNQFNDATKATQLLKTYIRPGGCYGLDSTTPLGTPVPNDTTNPMHWYSINFPNPATELVCN